LAVGALGGSLFEEALEQEGREPQEGIFRSSERNPALSGETAEAHPACWRTIVGVPAGVSKRASDDEHGLAHGSLRKPSKDEQGFAGDSDEGSDG
jgi:hypothetical protein